MNQTEQILREIVEAEHRVLEAAYANETAAEMDANEDFRRAIQAAINHVDALDEERKSVSGLETA